jgi:hypothetical protein
MFWETARIGDCMKLEVDCGTRISRAGDVVVRKLYAN